MSAEAWFRFFPSDWLGGTAGLSAAEKGVYVTLIALIYDCGGPLNRDDVRLARQCGMPKAGFVRAVESLISLGKLTVEDGCLTNSRVKSELTERENRIERARLGASVTNEKKAIKSKQDLRPSDTCSVRPSIASDDATRARVPQPQPQSLEDKPLKTTRDARFERFWSAWPNKVQRPYAQKCFAKVAGEIEAIVSGVDRYVREKPPDRPWLNPSTFLNQRRWEDAPAAIAPGGQNGSKRSLVDAGRALHARLVAERERRERGAGDSSFVGEPALRLLPGIGGQ